MSQFFGQAGLLKAVHSFWSSHLDGKFKKFWTEQSRTRFRSLNEGTALPDCPHPLCILTIDPPVIDGRTSGDVSDINTEFRDYGVTFTVHAKEMQGSNKDSKELAWELASQIMAVLGGHPSEKPKKLSLDVGEITIVEYSRDFGEQTGDHEYQWSVVYSIKTETPFAIQIE